MKFKDKTVIVTGGAQGIGMAVCQLFAKEGARVVIVDIDDEAGIELQNSIKASGGEALFIHTDISLEDNVRMLVEKTIMSYGSVHILINNAGIGAGGTLETRPLEDWDRVLAVNLKGPYMMAKYCAPALENIDQGIIINITSTRALMSEAHTEPYSASKGGLLALTHSLAVSMGPKVRVNAISPGWIEVSNYRKSSEIREPVHSPKDHSQHPVGRVGKPEDIAHACIFLSSPEAGFITGTNLIIDGGMSIKMIYEE